MHYYHFPDNRLDDRHYDNRQSIPIIVPEGTVPMGWDSRSPWRSSNAVLHNALHEVSLLNSHDAKELKVALMHFRMPINPRAHAIASSMQDVGNFHHNDRTRTLEYYRTDSYCLDLGVCVDSEENRDAVIAYDWGLIKFHRDIQIQIPRVRNQRDQFEFHSPGLWNGCVSPGVSFKLIVPDAFPALAHTNAQSARRQ